MTILGIGNVLERDDGIGVYASLYLQKNYTFTPNINIVNGGVEGIALLNRFEDDTELLILDAINIDDTSSSIYLIPANELESRGLNVGGAHEIGVLETLTMLELQEKPIPDVTILGIVPAEVYFDIGLSETLKASFNRYIDVALEFLANKGIKIYSKEDILPLNNIIDNIRKF